MNTAEYEKKYSFKHPQCSDELERVMMATGCLHFLNTSIIPPGADGTWVVEEVESPFVRYCLLYLGHAGLVDFYQSHVGHEATAAVASELFEVKIPMDRTPWDGVGVAIALQLKGRLPEGQILSRDELEKIGYTVRVMYRRPAYSSAPPPASNPAMAELATRLRNIANRVDRCGGGDLTSLIEVGESTTEQGRSRYVLAKDIADFLDQADHVRSEGEESFFESLLAPIISDADRERLQGRFIPGVKLDPVTASRIGFEQDVLRRLAELETAVASGRVISPALLTDLTNYFFATIADAGYCQASGAREPSELARELYAKITKGVGL